MFVAMGKAATRMVERGPNGTEAAMSVWRARPEESDCGDAAEAEIVVEGGVRRTSPCGCTATKRMGKSGEGHEVSRAPEPRWWTGNMRLSMARSPQAGQTETLIPVSARSRSCQEGRVGAGRGWETSSGAGA